MSAIVPIPKQEIAFRIATMEDIPAIDALQKQHSKALGFFKKQWLEGYIRKEWILLAVDAAGRVLGYIASRDRYLKRDELGVIYQLCVAPGEQRKLVGAALVREVFARSAYGCRLYCCWCAKDLEANYFWESMGFVPIAFRAGSRGKKRVHIFWQKRIVEGDSETKWWYPFKTDQGAIREDRIVFPIPPGVSWKDVEAVASPSTAEIGDQKSEVRKALPGPRSRVTPKVKPRPIGAPMGGFVFQSELKTGKATKPATKSGAKTTTKMPKPKAEPVKFDPKFLAAARELRDRWMEKANADPSLLSSIGKYNLTRQIEASSAARVQSTTKLLDAA